MDANEKNNTQNLSVSKDALEVLQVILALLKSDADDFEVPAFLKENPEFQSIHSISKETKHFCDALKEGNLNFRTEEKSYTIGQLKSIQTELRNLVWQLQELANGNNYIHSVFTGEIGESFNTMIERLNLTIKEIREVSKTYEEVSSHDPLTGCHSKKALKKEFLQSINKAAKNQQNCGLFVLDLDQFKSVNDTFGHNTGDMVLKHFVKKIYDTIRDSDLCCRLGGEEFAVLFPNTTQEILMRIDERLRNNIAKINIERKNAVITCTYSAGITLFPAHHATESSLQKIIGFAEKLLHEAKENGKNRSIFAEYSAK